MVRSFLLCTEVVLSWGVICAIESRTSTQRADIVIGVHFPPATGFEGYGYWFSEDIDYQLEYTRAEICWDNLVLSFVLHLSRCIGIFGAIGLPSAIILASPYPDSPCPSLQFSPTKNARSRVFPACTSWIEHAIPSPSCGIQRCWWSFASHNNRWAKDVAWWRPSIALKKVSDTLLQESGW
jgi:hypothetical protein